MTVMVGLVLSACASKGGTGSEAARSKASAPALATPSKPSGSKPSNPTASGAPQSSPIVHQPGTGQDRRKSEQRGQPPMQPSGYEPPVPSRAKPPQGTSSVADHPATPGPEVQQAQSPPGGLPDKLDTPAEPQHVFETDVRGETKPDDTVIIGARTADNKPLDPSHLCSQRPADGEEAIDHTRRRVEEMVCTASMWFDGLFGDRYYVSESRKVYGTLEVINNWSEFYGDKTRIRFDARVDLPNINHHLSAFIGRDNQDDFIRDRFDNSALRNSFPKVDDRDKVFAGLGYALPSNDVVQTSARAGVRGFAHPEAFVQGRAQYNAYADTENLVSLRATPFWTSSDKLGVTVGGDYSHVLNEDMLFRYGNVGTLSQTTQGLDWRSTLTVYEAVRSIKSGLAYELFIRGETGDDVPLHEYGFQTTFRHPMFRGKLYGEWVLGYSFPRDDQDQKRDGSMLAGFGVQMPFGQRRD